MHVETTLCYLTHVDPRGGGGAGGPDPRKNLGFLSNTGPDPLKITKLSSQHSMLGHHRAIIGKTVMAFRWRADDGPLIVVFGSSLFSSTNKPQPHLIPSKKKNVKVGPL